MAQITRLGLYGGPRRLYGAFTSKAVELKPVGILTRLGMYGGPRGLYGDFSGKTLSAPEPFTSDSGVARPPDRHRMLLNRPRNPTPRLFRRR